MKPRQTHAPARMSISNDPAKLRRHAEARLRTSGTKASRPTKEADLQRLLHELQVHQIELEIQNEELQRAQIQLETVLSDYTALYDFAPIGYFTLDREGTIRRLNLAAAKLLGIDRAKGGNRLYVRFVAVDLRPAFTSFLSRAFEHGNKEVCETRLQPQGSTPRWVWMEACATVSGKECLLAVLDITERKQAEAAQARLARQVHAASEWEQRCVGEGLQEDLCQRLAGIKYLSDAMAKAMKRDECPESDLAAEIAQELHGSLEQALRFADILQPVSRLEQGLAAAIDRLASQVQERSRIRCSFTGEDLPQVAASDATELYRIAQDAVNNAARHKAVSRIEVGLFKSPRHLTLTVEDDGLTSAKESIPEPGFGLQLIRYRSGVLGAELTIEAKPVRGTVVTCRYPLAEGRK